MQITVIDVSENTKKSESGRTFQQLEVAYKNEQGIPQLKKLIPFSNPNMYKLAKSWVKGDVFNVTTIKNDKGYWEWTGIEGDNSVTQETKSTTPLATRVTGSNYETKEERAARQVYIIRQSSLSTAVELLGQGKSVSDVINVAKQFEAYVFDQSSGVDAINDLADDIPA